MSIRTIVVLVFVATPITVMAGNLSLRETLQLIIDDHPAIKAEKYAAKIAYFRQQSIVGRQDWRVNSRLRYSKTKYDPDTNSFNQNDRDREIDLGVRKLFWGSGAQLNVSLNTRKFSDDEYRSYNDVSLSIPLLDNFGGIQSRYAYEQQAFRIDLSTLNQNEYIENFLVGISHNYLIWAAAIENKKLSQGHLESLQKLNSVEFSSLSELAKKRYHFRIDWEISEAEKTHSLIIATVKSALTRLVKLSDIGSSKFTKPNINLKTKKHFINSATPTIIPLASLRLLRNFKINHARNEHTIKLDKNSLLPSLTLNFSTGISGWGEHYKSSQDNDTESIGSSLNFNTPISNTRNRANLKSSQLRKQEIDDRSNSQELVLKSVIYALYEQLAELSKTIDLSVKELQLADQSIEWEIKALKENKIDISNYLTTLQDVYSQKRQFVTTSVFFQNLFVEYLSATDQLWDGEKLTGNI